MAYTAPTRANPFGAETMPEPLLVELAEEVREIAESAEMERRKKLWETLFRGERPEKPPVKCGLFMSRWMGMAWQRLIGEDAIHFKTGVERDVEVQLCKRIYKFRRLNEDDVLPLTVWVFAEPVVDADALWGLKISRDRPAEAGGAYKEVPPIREESDLEHLTLPHYARNVQADRAAIEHVRELIDDRLPVKLHTGQMHFGPYEYAVLLRGAEPLLFDLYDRPEFVHRLMDRITEGITGYTLEREAAGDYDVEEGMLLHEPWDAVEPGREHELSAGWVYSHAQSSAPLGPEHYAQFVQPYNARPAQLFGKVYYHGCEDLGDKVAVIKDLPNLRHFHVSPWTDVKKVLPHLRGRGVAMEVHGHPTNVLIVWGPDGIREETRRRMAECEDLPFDYVLCDIQTVEGHGEKLAIWCDVAQEDAERL